MSSVDSPKLAKTYGMVRAKAQKAKGTKAPSSTMKKAAKVGQKKHATGVKVVPPKLQGVVGMVAIVAPIAEDDAVVLRTRYDFARDNRQCTCHFLKLLLVKPLRRLARELNIETVFVDGAVRKKIAKPLLLLSLCGVCQTVEDVAAVGGGEREGIPAKFWAPLIIVQILSVLDAMHLSFRQAIESVPNGPTAVHIRFELNRFRAHLLSHAETNGRRYLFQGKVNLVGEHGSVVTQRRRLREATFGIAMQATMQHYDNIHSNLYCGKLRKGQACVPFQTWEDCSDAVRPMVQTQVVRLCIFVIDRGENDRVMKIEDPFLGSQQELRTHFRLPLLQ
jgi:hypothetical protein